MLGADQKLAPRAVLGQEACLGIKPRPHPAPPPPPPEGGHWSGLDEGRREGGQIVVQWAPVNGAPGPDSPPHRLIFRGSVAPSPVKLPRSGGTIKNPAARIASERNSEAQSIPLADQTARANPQRLHDPCGLCSGASAALPGHHRPAPHVGRPIPPVQHRPRAHTRVCSLPLPAARPWAVRAPRARSMGAYRPGHGCGGRRPWRGGVQAAAGGGGVQPAAAGGGIQGTPTYLLRNDRHVALMFLMGDACWGHNCFVQKKSAAPKGGGVPAATVGRGDGAWGQIRLNVFPSFFISPLNSSIHSNRKKSVDVAFDRKNFSAPRFWPTMVRTCAVAGGPERGAGGLLGSGI